MGKRVSFIMLLQFFIAVLALISVSLAWFTLSDQTQTEDINFGVTEGMVTNYQYIVYTQDNVYKFNQSTKEFTMFDANLSDWVAPPTTIDSFNGIMIDAYDSLIEENNIYNHLFIELYLEYDVEVNLEVYPKLVANHTLANQTIYELGYNTSRPYYISEVILSQMMIMETYQDALEGTNLYSNLKSDFLSQPTYSFYDGLDVYQTSINFNSLLFEANSLTGIHLYFSLSYYEEKIDEIMATEQISFDFSTSNSVVFFQDLNIYFTDSGG